jgi:glycosyltransferase involved in cell wall biosynthesis
MKVLFVCSGNSKVFEISPFYQVQVDSISELGHQVDVFSIKGKGISGYLKNVLPLKRVIKRNEYDIIHAHYSMSAFVATLASLRVKRDFKSVEKQIDKKTSFYHQHLVVSLVGSDVCGSTFWQAITRFFARFFWPYLIVVSPEMKDKLGLPWIEVIPQGVDIKLFRELGKNECREELGLNQEDSYVLFVANPERKEKNYPLARDAFNLIKTDNTHLVICDKISREQIPIYMNACDVLILSSHREGSPNVVKEGMACNCPIVSTDVGDVRWLLGEIEGHYIAESNPEDFADKIKQALEFGRKTKGRERLIELGIGSESIARRITTIYEGILRD